jgi:glycosyltransferase involved in cell wall biosynthesis
VDAASLLFTHNVEAEIFERHVRVARFPMRAVWQGQARRMRDFEGAALRRFDRAIAVSARDADVLARDYGIPRPEVIDTGVDLDFFPYTPPPAAGDARGGTIVFTGAMDWRANIDGIEFLMQQVWPLVLARRPAARVVVVGRNPPEALVARAPGESWRFTGFVDDIRPHVAAAQLYVIPLRVGSGTRIKAFEAMAMGRPVVSTPVGVEGLDVQPGEHYLAAGADDPAAFAAAILRLLDDPGLAARLAEAARRRVEERFSWSHVARQFEAICLRAVASRANPG